MLATGRRIDRGADRRRTVSRRPESHCTPHSADDAARRRRPRAGGAALLRGRHRGRVRRRFGHRAWRVRQPRRHPAAPAGRWRIASRCSRGWGGGTAVRSPRRAAIGCWSSACSRQSRAPARCEAHGPRRHHPRAAAPIRILSINPSRIRRARTPSRGRSRRPIARRARRARSGCPDRARCASRFPARVGFRAEQQHGRHAERAGDVDVRGAGGHHGIQRQHQPRQALKSPIA